MERLLASAWNIHEDKHGFVLREKYSRRQFNELLSEQFSITGEKMTRADKRAESV